MVRELPFTAGLTALIVLVFVHKTCSTLNNIHQCPPSSCGNIQNIINPFRLTSDPEACGYLWYELSCENNGTVLKLFEGKYNVQEINYSNYTIRVVDSGIHEDNYFSTPSYSLYPYNFSSRPRTALSYDLSTYYTPIVVFMSCEKPVNSPFYLDTSTCNGNGEYTSNSSISHSKRYKYVTTGIIRPKDVEDSCRLEQMVPTSRPRNDNPNISCTEVHNELVYGFELSWFSSTICEIHCGRRHPCHLDDLNNVRCGGKIGG